MSLVNVIGWDIGGANTKIAFVNVEDGLVKEVRVASEYFPVWKNHENLSDLLSELARKVAESAVLDGVGVTMTAELSDSYHTKREGVRHILAQVAQVFNEAPISVLDVDGKLKSVDEAGREALKVAASNWAATGWMVSQLMKNCVVIDVGSTTTSIIPVVNGIVSAAGKTDMEKLLNGELVYTGCLRTNVAAIVNSLPVRGGVCQVSSELFATSGDVHLILGNIAEEEFTVETADGKGKTRMEALARLARVVCADMEILSEQEIVDIAQYIYDKQVAQVANGLSQVYNRIKQSPEVEFAAVVTGLGKNFLARAAAQKVGFPSIVDLDELVQSDMANASAAVGVALMTASKLIGRTVQWKR